MSLPNLSTSHGKSLFSAALTSSSSSALLPNISADQNNSTHTNHQSSQHGGRPPRINNSKSGLLQTMGGGITSGSSLLDNSHSRISSSSSTGTLPPGWIVAQHSVNGKKYFYNENSKETTWNRPAFTRDKQALYQLRPEHRSLYRLALSTGATTYVSCPNADVRLLTERQADTQHSQKKTPTIFFYREK